MLRMMFGSILLMISAHAHATFPMPGMGIMGMGMGMADKCTAAANGAALDNVMGMGIDPDGVAFNFDEKGKTNVLKPENIVSQNTKDGVETIVYKVRQQKFSPDWKLGTPMEYETVQRVVTVKRNKSGQIISVNKDVDLNPQLQLRKMISGGGMKAAPLMKSIETTFSHNGKECDINQNIVYEMENEAAKVEAKVNYDKAFCKKLEPLVRQLGQQNATQCVGLINQAKFAYDERAKELAKEGKKFKADDFVTDKKSSKLNMMSNMDMGMMISSCATYGGYFGYGMGMFGGPFGLSGGYGMAMSASDAQTMQPKADAKKVDNKNGIH
ncbi:MAG: hypothetical protein ACXVCY_04925 [Pseudobdellovibrionaceae bacterium]